MLAVLSKLSPHNTLKAKMMSLSNNRIPVAVFVSVVSLWQNPAMMVQGFVAPAPSSCFPRTTPTTASFSRSTASLFASNDNDDDDDLYIPPDFTVNDDPPDLAVDGDGFFKTRGSKSAPYIPPEITFHDNDDQDDDKSAPAARYEPPTDVTAAAPKKKKTSTKSNDDDSFYNMQDEDESSSTGNNPKRVSRKSVAGSSGPSWMDRNAEFTNTPVPAQQDDDSNSFQSRGGGGGRDNDRGSRGGRDNNSQQRDGGRGRGDDNNNYERRSFNNNRDKDNNNGNSNRSFRQDFRGTRVFVQGLPPTATWQDLKDHFRSAGEVVFASVSTDRVTGESKCCGIVQYETTEMAEQAIVNMRNFPMDGFKLYVREDVQEGREGKTLNSAAPEKRGPTPPSTWLCANEENAGHLSDDERSSIRTIIKARDDARRRRQYEASDSMREELRNEFGVHVDDRLKMWWTAVDDVVPQKIRDAKGEGSWDDPKAWRQIPTTPENDACVNPDLVYGLLTQRDIARREKDFGTADSLLVEARESPDGDLYLRIHDESRTWRIWTESAPPRPVRHRVDSEKTAAQQCVDLTTEYAPHKLQEMETLLEKFPGREYNILKKLKKRYLQ